MAQSAPIRDRLCHSPFLVNSFAAVVAMALPTILDSHPHSEQDSLDFFHSYFAEEGHLDYNNSGPDPDPSECAEPDAKRHKGTGSGEGVPNVEKEEPPKESMTKWVMSKRGILPFTKNVETNVIHCGYSRMKMVQYVHPSTNKDHRLILCLSGCEGYCKGPGQCNCFCHILQADYDRRE